MKSALSAEVVQLDQKLSDAKRQFEQLQKDKAGLGDTTTVATVLRI